MRQLFGSPTLLTLILMLPAIYAHAGDHCTTQETTYFNCDTAKHKTISLCGATPSTLQYRYGKPEKVELAFPEKPADGVNQMRYAHYFRYQTDRTEITFNRGGTDYALFDYTEDGKRTAGVHVTMPDGTEHETVCAGHIKSNLNALEKILHCDADNALNQGSCS